MARVIKIENGKTVATWQEARGKKTLTRVFFLQYEVNAICNGKYYLLRMCDTMKDAVRVLNETKKKCERKYGVAEWLNLGSIITHEECAGFWHAYKGKKSIQLYIHEVAGKRISENVK